MTKKLLILSLAILLLPSLVFGAWTYEQNFNNLNNGDLTGQDNWSGNVLFDVQTNVRYEGEKAVMVVGNATITRAISPISEGIVYVAMRTDNLAGENQWTMWLTENLSSKMAITFNAETGTIRVLTPVNIISYTNGQWYVIEIEFNDTTQPDKYRARAFDGNAWSNWTIWVNALGGSYSNINGIELSSNGNTNYFDIIGPTDPTIPPPPVCDNEHLNLCLTEITCSNAGGYWYNAICNASPPLPTYQYVDFEPTNFVASLKTNVLELANDLMTPLILMISLPIAFWFISKAISVVQGGLKDKKE